jgi:hypothetical protein
MRALTKEECAVLDGEHNGYVHDARLVDVAHGLILRGCARSFINEEGSLEYTITPLGLLARRVSRPEQVMRLP